MVIEYARQCKAFAAAGALVGFETVSTEQEQLRRLLEATADAALAPLEQIVHWRLDEAADVLSLAQLEVHPAASGDKRRGSRGMALTITSDALGDEQTKDAQVALLIALIRAGRALRDSGDASVRANMGVSPQDIQAVFDARAAAGLGASKPPRWFSEGDLDGLLHRDLLSRAATEEYCRRPH